MDSQTLDPSNAPQISAEPQALTPSPEKTPEPKKRGRKRSTAEKTKETEENGDVEGEEGKRKKSTASVTDVVSAERPSRERKVVERFSSMSATPKSVASAKVLCFQQGPGTKLKEIPNVLFKVSKRKPDDILQILHTLLFGKKSNVHFLKKNILQFSGFVWTENEEKQRTRMKDRLDKLNKEKLYEICELLDVHAVKTSTRKEEVTSKLLEFLESPTVTRDVVLAEKMEKAKKKKKARRIRKSSGKKSTEKRSKKLSKKQKDSSEQNEEENGDGDVAETNEASTDNEDDHDFSGGDDEHNASEQEEEEDVKEEDKPVGSIEESVDKSTNDVDSSKIKQTPTKNASSKISNTSTSKSATKRSEGEENSPEEKERSSSKGQNGKGSKVPRKKNVSEGNKSSSKAAEANKSTSVSTSKDSGAKTKKVKKGPESDNPKPTSKQSAKEESKVSTKKQEKSKSGEGSKAGPSTEELHAAVTNILKAVDFNTATLADILKQLGTHFKMDLVDRKSEIKLIIEDVISNMSDAEDGNEDSEGDTKDSGNDDDYDADE